MKKEIPFKVQKGKIVENASGIRDQILSLDDGSYILVVHSINPLTTVTDYRKAYFAMVDECVAETGNDRKTIHRAFKANQEVDSTTKFTIIQWREFLNKFKFYAYNEMNIIV